jgi:hypothetical protein
MAKGALKGNVQALAALTDLIEVLVNVSRIKESKPYFKSGRSTKLPKVPVPVWSRNFGPEHHNFRKVMAGLPLRQSSSPV